MKPDRMTIQKMITMASCVLLFLHGGCGIPEEPAFDSPVDPKGAQYKADPPSIAWVNQNSDRGCWVVITVGEPYVTTVHLERKGGPVREFVEVRAFAYRFPSNVSDSSGVLIIDSVYTYRARVRAIGGAFSAYSREASVKARQYSSN